MVTKGPKHVASHTIKYDVFDVRCFNILIMNSSCLSVTKIEFGLNVAATSEAHKLSIKYYWWGKRGVA